MPRIPRIQSRVSAPGPVDTPRVRTADLYGSAPDAAVARQLAETSAQLGDAVGRRNEQREISTLSAGIADVHAALTNRLTDLAQASDGRGDFSKEYMGEVDQHLAELRKGATTSAGKLFFDKAAAELRDHFTISSYETQVKLAGEFAKTSHQRQMSSLVNTVTLDPSGLDAALSTNQYGIEALVASRGLSRAGADALALADKQALWGAALDGLISRAKISDDPAQAESLLGRVRSEPGWRENVAPNDFQRAVQGLDEAAVRMRRGKADDFLQVQVQGAIESWMNGQDAKLGTRDVSLTEVEAGIRSFSGLTPAKQEKAIADARAAYQIKEVYQALNRGDVSKVLSEIGDVEALRGQVMTDQGHVMQALKHVNEQLAKGVDGGIDALIERLKDGSAPAAQVRAMFEGFRKMFPESLVLSSKKSLELDKELSRAEFHSAIELAGPEDLVALQQKLLQDQGSPDLKYRLGEVNRELGARADRLKEVLDQRIKGIDATGASWLLENFQNDVAGVEGFFRAAGKTEAAQSLQNARAQTVERFAKEYWEKPSDFLMKDDEVKISLDRWLSAIENPDGGRAFSRYLSALNDAAALRRLNPSRINDKVLPEPALQAIRDMYLQMSPTSPEGAVDVTAKLQAATGAAWPLVSKQLARDGFVMNPVRALYAMGDLSQGSFRQIAGQLERYSQDKPEELRSKLPEKLNDQQRVDAIESVVGPFARTFELDAYRRERSGALYEGLERAALGLANARGLSFEDAAAEVYRKTIGQNYVLPDGAPYTRLRLPVKWNKDSVFSGMEGTIERLTPDDLLDTDEARAEMRGSTALERKTRILDAVTADPHWMLSDDESGVVLYDNNFDPVMAARGRQLFMSFAQLEALGVQRGETAAARVRDIRSMRFGGGT